MKFEATYYDGVHPVVNKVTVLVSSNGKANFIGAEISYNCHWQDILVGNQLGNTARSLQLPNGAKCESFAQKEINQLQNQFSASVISRYIHKLESHWYYVLTASLVVAVFTWGMIVYGIPSLAKTVAHALPVSIDERLAEGTLTILDERLLKASELDKKIQSRLQDKFLEMVRNTQDDHNFQLLFRKGLGANAFALPSGHVVVTDELVEIADNDDEILAVLAHEIGHVVHEHGLRSVLQSSAVALLLTAVTGDISSTSGFAAAMPIILLETSYSRKFELEADEYALDYMQAYNIDTKHFATILEKITGIEDSLMQDNAFSYLSTHPATYERIQPFIDNSITK
ncbi:MAG: M48 family metallopeptidase [Gammaproteobacteria bacterium]|nr:M48 family metallopeptidase [Gammaproteobacteria bacterium]